jgi:hypothetical protein
MAAADELTDAWFAGRCVHDVPLCEPPPTATCRRGTCAERPPPGVPEDWHRERVPGILTMFLPPDLQRIPAQGEDSFVLVYQGGGRRIHIEISEYAPDPSPAAHRELAPWDTPLPSESLVVAGRPTTLFRYQLNEHPEKPSWTADARVPNVASPWAMLTGNVDSKLYFGLSCETKDGCNVAPTILRSLAVLTEPVPR